MGSRSFVLRAGLLAVVSILPPACSTDTTIGGGNGGSAGQGGSSGAPGTGGTPGQGGSAGTGGITGSGGVTSGTGGRTSGSGGASATGGQTTVTGGVSGTGGMTTGTGGQGKGAGGIGVGGTGAGGTGTGGKGVGGTGVGGTGAGGTSAGGTGAGGTGAGGTGAGGTGAGGTSAGGTTGTFVENEGIDCTVGAMPTPTANAKLPNPFKKLDGTIMATKAEWRCRRQEIVKLAETFAYGAKEGTPTTTGSVTASKITVNVAQGGKTVSFTATITAPTSGSKPYPAIIGYSMPGFSALSIDASILNSEGVATIVYDVTQVGQEGTGRTSKAGAYYTLNGSTSKTGLLMAWAWGVSRIIDVIQQSDGSIIKVDALGVTGCSRLGKGAFVAGAFDQRVALSIPMESGSAGVPIWRGIPGEGAQTLSSAYGEQPWFGDAFSAFTSDPTKAPLDTHEVVALIAPRGALILDNPGIANLGPKSAHVAALGGVEVYKALGVADVFSYHSDTTNGTHCSVRTEYAQPTKDAIQRFLTKKGTVAGAIKASSSTTGKLSDWSDWTTPTLN